MKTTPKITTKEVALIKKAQAGDILAFNKLFYCYKQFVDSILYSYLKDMDEAQDLTNIVFLKVYDKLSTFTDYSSFGGWLRIIANRTAIDYLRRTKTNKSKMELDNNRLLLSDPIGYNEDDLVNRLTYERLLKEFSNLSDQARKVCELFYVENMTVQQICDETGIPSGTIKSHLSRTRQKIKKHFKL